MKLWALWTWAAIFSFMRGEWGFLEQQKQRLNFVFGLGL